MNWRYRGAAVLAGAFLFASGPARLVEGQSASAAGQRRRASWTGMRAPRSSSSGPAARPRSPPLGLVDLAIVHTAIYDAVNATAGFPFRSYAVVPNVPGPASGDAAVAAAGRGTLLALFPDRGADIEAWYAASLATIPDGAEKANGISSASRPRPGSSPCARTTAATRGPRSWSRPRPTGSGSARLPPSPRRRRPGAALHHALEPGPPVAAPARPSAAALSPGSTGRTTKRRSDFGAPPEASRPRSRRTSAASGAISRCSSGTGPGAGSRRRRRSRAWTRRATSPCSRPPARTP